MQLIAHHHAPLVEQLAAGGTGLELELVVTLCARCSGRIDGARGTAVRIARQQRQ